MASFYPLVITLAILQGPNFCQADWKDSPLGKISLTTNARATYDSNVFSMPSAQFASRSAATTSLKSEDDLILELTPAAHFTKKIKMIELRGTIGARGAYFVSNREKSFVNPITTFSIDFDESLTKRISNNAKIRFDALFDVGQKTETSVLENDLTSYTYYSVGLNMRYNHSPKFGLGAGANYTFRDYQTGAVNNTYHDVTSIPISARAFYIYSPKTDFFTEYTYSPTRGGPATASTIDAVTHEFVLGAQGNLLTKASGSVRIGYVTKQYDNPVLSSQGGLSLETGIDWKLNQKTSTRLNLNRAFQPSPQDQSILSTSLGLALNHRLNEKMNAEIHASWSKSAYTKALTSDRNMDMFTIGAFLRKNLSQHFDVGGGYDFSTASQSVGGDFDRHILYVDVNGRY
jgi:hypothetical protein